MQHNDIPSREELFVQFQQALKENDVKGVALSFEQLFAAVERTAAMNSEAAVNDLRQEMDTSILTARGVRQLTGEERKYYQKVIEAMKSRDPKQALANMDVTLPETVISSVFDDLRVNHPLLNVINFVPSSGTTRMITNTNGYQEAAWGQLCDDIVKELTSGFKEITTDLLKLSAFIPVCRSMLELGPEWLDRYVRDVLYEAYANGLEAGIVAGDGNGKPIGMTRQVGEGVTVVGGVYPKKEKITLTSIDTETIGSLLSILSISPTGKLRPVREVLFIVNPYDYYSKVMPATTMMAPDGTYRNDVMPYPMRVIQSPALEQGEALIGLGNLYFATAGIGKEGRIEYSDHYRFLEDERVYLIKGYANGLPLDNNAFLLLDISNLRPAVFKVQQVTAPAASAEAALADLRIGGHSLSPAFDSAVTAYTVATSNATNTITATPTDASAEVTVTVNGELEGNGSAAAWNDGENTVVVTVTAADGITTKSYTVTVTKE